MARKPSTAFEREFALAVLLANDGDIAATSAELKLSSTTLRQWQREAAAHPVDALGAVRALLAHHALTLAHTLLQDDHPTPLNQRASALGMLIEKLLKLEQRAGAASAPPTVEVIYTDPDGSHHRQPRWWRDPEPATDADQHHPEP